MYIPFVSITYKLAFLNCTVLYRRILTEWNFWLMFLPVFMHLFVYTRHSIKGPRRHDRFWRRCHCPKWIRGFLNGKPIRIAAKTADWEKAEEKARQMEHPSSPQPLTQPSPPQVENPLQRVKIEEAVDAFLEDEEGRQLRKGTTGQSKTLLRKQLVPWAHQQNVKYLDQLTATVLTRFRAYWSKDLENGANTARRKHERLCGFFHFCIRSEWINKNPARLLKPIEVCPHAASHILLAGLVPTPQIG